MGQEATSLHSQPLDPQVGRVCWVRVVSQESVLEQRIIATLRGKRDKAGREAGRISQELQRHALGTDGRSGLTGDSGRSWTGSLLQNLGEKGTVSLRHGSVDFC